MPSLPFAQGKPLDVPRTVQQALELYHQGRIAEAERLYAAVLAVRPNNVDALLMLSVIKLSHGELGTALRLILAAMQQRPKSPLILFNYGLVLVAMKRHEEALAPFEQAIKYKSRFRRRPQQSRRRTGGPGASTTKRSRALTAPSRSSRTTPRPSIIAALRCTSSVATVRRCKASNARSRCARATPRRMRTAASSSTRSDALTMLWRATTARSNCTRTCRKRC